MVSHWRWAVRPSQVVVAFAACIAALAVSSRARADEIDRCLASHPRAQNLRLDGKVRAARAELLVCSRPVCPAVIRTECGRWLGEIDALIPAIVVSVRTAAGDDLSDVRVTVDGELQLRRLVGRPLSLDPGAHRVQVEAEGYAPVEQSIVLAEGEQARPILFTLSARTAPAGAPEPGPAPTSPETTRRPVPTTVYVLGGAAVLALASFTYFGLTGRSEYFDYKKQCAPSCPKSDSSSVFTHLLAADVSLGVAVVAIGAGAIVFFSRPTVAGARPGGLRLGVGAGAHGAEASAVLVF